MKKTEALTWSKAFRQQAVADYHTFHLLNEARTKAKNAGIQAEIEADCLMLLQMTIEKLFKSAYADITGDEPKHDHAPAIYNAIQILAKPSTRTNRQKVKNKQPLRLTPGILLLIRKHVSYHPHADFGCRISDGQFEHLWLSDKGIIKYPAKYSNFNNLGFTDHLKNDLYKLLKHCLIDKWDDWVNQLRPCKNNLAI